MSFKAGDKFKTNSCGEVVIVEINSSRDVLVEFSDGVRVQTNSGRLRDGCIRNPMHSVKRSGGYIGIGGHRPCVNSVDTPAYKVWAGMHNRVSDHVKYPAYANVTLCNEWYNFQNFAEWYYAQAWHSVKGYQIDKDILNPGNTVYSANSCSLVPRDINMLFVNNVSRGDLPVGVFKQPKGESYHARLSIKGRQIVIGRYATIEDAELARESAKSKYAFDLAQEYKSQIDLDIYNILTSSKT